MIDIYISCKNIKAAYARLQSFGIRIKAQEEETFDTSDPENPVWNGTGKADLLTRPEEACEYCMTPAHFDDASQKYYFAVRMEEAQAARLTGFPNTPNFYRHDLETWPDFAPRFA